MNIAHIPMLSRVLVAGASAGLVGIAGLAAATPVLGASPVGAVLTAATPSPSASAGAGRRSDRDHRQDRRQIAAAVLASEAQVLGLTPAQLRQDRRTQSLAAIAASKGITSESAFAAKLSAALKPRLDALVKSRAITQAQEDRVLDRLAKGRVPGWNHVPGTHRAGAGIRHHGPTTTTPSPAAG